jgi:hypothetical protein
MAYSAITEEIKNTLNEFTKELELINSNNKAAGKRARVALSKFRKLAAPWKAALKARETEYPKRTKKEA